jgi:hypothetical protein
MSILEIPCNTPLIDSLSLKIPLEDVTIIDKRLTSSTHTYYADLEVIELDAKPPKPIKISFNGINLTIGIANQPHTKTNGEQTTKPFVFLTLSSKLLKNRYFQGINNHNIESLYEHFIQFEIFFCTLEVFLNSQVNDIDVCLNRYVEDAYFIKSLEKLQSQCGIKKDLSKIINEPLNKGISFKQRNTSTPGLPFIKIYHKELELLSKSLEFYEHYIKDSYSYQIINLSRVECTIRNYKHKRRLEKYNVLPMFRTLQELLDIPEANLYKFIVFSFNSYIEQIKPFNITAQLSPNDFIIMSLMQKLILKGEDAKSLLHIADSYKTPNLKSKVVIQSKIRTKLKSTFDHLAFQKSIVWQNTFNSHVTEYLKFLNL